MKKSNFWLGIQAIALVFGMTILGACASAPAVDPILPDEKSAVVYFYGYRSDGASVWDGETPIGDFGEGPVVGYLAWKTTPGEHYFLSNTFNWNVMKASLKANNTYYVKLESIPNPIPFAKNMVVMRPLEAEDGEAWFKKSRTKTFTDEWRAKFAQGKILEEAKEQLQEARKDKSKEIGLK